MNPGAPRPVSRICKLSINEQSLVAECKAERLRMIEERARLKEQDKRLSRQIAELGVKALAQKFGVSPSTIDKIQAAGV